MIRPPIVGPRIGASIAGTATRLITRPIRFGPGGLGHHQLADRQDHAAADALQDAEQDQLGGRRREAAERRADREQHQRDQVDGLAPKRRAAQPVTGITAASDSM